MLERESGQPYQPNEAEKIMAEFFPDAYLNTLIIWAKKYLNRDIELNYLKRLIDTNLEEKRIGLEGSDEEYEKLREKWEKSILEGDEETDFPWLLTVLRNAVPENEFHAADVQRFVEYGYSTESAEKAVRELEETRESFMKQVPKNIEDLFMKNKEYRDAKNLEKFEKSFNDPDDSDNKKEN